MIPSTAPLPGRIGVPLRVVSRPEGPSPRYVVSWPTWAHTGKFYVNLNVWGEGDAARCRRCNAVERGGEGLCLTCTDQAGCGVPSDVLRIYDPAAPRPEGGGS